MPPPLPPPAEASVGMSAAAPIAATVATAKIVLRIMGLSWFLLDVFSHPDCQSGERSVGFNGATIKNRRKIGGTARAANEFARGGVFHLVGAELACVAVLAFAPRVALGARKPSSRLAALRLARYKPPRSALLRFPL